MKRVLDTAQVKTEGQNGRHARGHGRFAHWIVERILHLRLAHLLFAVACMVVFGTLGYMAFAGIGPMDALFQAVNVVTTVGAENLADSAWGRAFGIVYSLLGVALASLTLSAIAAAIVEGRIRSVIGRRRMDHAISELRDHVILCGYGRFGQLTASELRRAGVPFVVIEIDHKHVEAAETHEMLVMEADATEEATLRRVGIEHARALLCTLPSDAENLYVILTARDMRAGAANDFPIVTLARAPNANRKLKRAGATHVVSPYAIGSVHMARQILSPHLVEVLNFARSGSDGLQKAGVFMEEFRIQPDSSLVGQSLVDSPLRREWNVMVVAVIGNEDTPIYSPRADYVFRAGDVLVSVGPDEGLAKLAKASRDGGET